MFFQLYAGVEERLRAASKTERGQGAERQQQYCYCDKADEKSAVLAFCEYLPQSYQLSLLSGLT